MLLSRGLQVHLRVPHAFAQRLRTRHLLCKVLRSLGGKGGPRDALVKGRSIYLLATPPPERCDFFCPAAIRPRSDHLHLALGKSGHPVAMWTASTMSDGSQRGARRTRLSRNCDAPSLQTLLPLHTSGISCALPHGGSRLASRLLPARPMFQRSHAFSQPQPRKTTSLSSSY